MNIHVAIVLAALLAPAVAAAATDNEKFEKLLAKTTISDFDDLQKVKAACVCRADQKAGILVRGFGAGQWLVTCFRLNFDTAGTATVMQPPCEDYEVLDK